MIDSLTETCQRNLNWASAYWYCSFSEAATQQPVNVLGSFILQLATHHPSILEDIRLVHASRSRNFLNRPIELFELEDTLCQHLRIFDRVFLLVDAINECQESEKELMGSLFRLMRKCNNLRLVISTVGEAPLDEKGNHRVMTVRCRPGKNQGDIATMIKRALATRPGLQDLGVGLKQDIHDNLLKQADGS